MHDLSSVFKSSEVNIALNLIVRILGVKIKISIIICLIFVCILNKCKILRKFQILLDETRKRNCDL